MKTHYLKLYVILYIVSHMELTIICVLLYFIVSHLSGMNKYKQSSLYVYI